MCKSEHLLQNCIRMCSFLNRSKNFELSKFMLIRKVFFCLALSIKTLYFVISLLRTKAIQQKYLAAKLFGTSQKHIYIVNLLAGNIVQSNRDYFIDNKVKYIFSFLPI